MVTESVVKVFSFTSSPSCLHTFPTQPNPRGLVSLSPSSANSVLAFPAPASAAPTSNTKSSSSSSSSGVSGTVQVVDLSADEADKDVPPLVIAAHDSRLSCLSVNIAGTLLATASDKGTLIRVFSTERTEGGGSGGTMVAELRRGTQPALIYSINFSPDSQLLCCSSSHGTIHVFAVSDGARNKHAPFMKSRASSNASSSSSASSSLSALNGMLPKYFSSEWSFARVEVPGGTPCVCAFGGSPNSVVAVCADGSYNKFLFEPGKGSAVRYSKCCAYYILIEKCRCSLSLQGRLPNDLRAGQELS